MRNNHLFSKCASGILSLSLIMAAIPAVPAMAEEAEGISDEEVYEEDYAEEGDAALEEVYEEAPIETEEQSPVFVITRYVDFDKAEDGTYIEEETRNQYGSITAVPGTALDDLGLPEDLEVEGYWLADGSDYLTVLTLEDMEWKLKSDTGESTEIYNEASPEGVYVFQPDYETWLLSWEDFDGIQLADGVKELELTVTVVSETEATPESTEDSSAELLGAGEEVTGETDADDGSVGETIADNGTTGEATADDGSTGETTADGGSAVEVSGEALVEDVSGDTSSDEDIFANLDTTAISESTTESWQSTSEDGVIMIDDGSEADTGTGEPETSAVVVIETNPSDTDSPETTPSSETTADSESTADSETTVDSETAQSSEASAGLDVVNDNSANSVTGTLSFYSDAAYTAKLSDVTNVTVSTNQTEPITGPTLSCSTDLSLLYITFTADGESVPVSLTNSEGAALLDFSSGSSTVNMTLNGTSYSFTLTASKADHSWTDATCTTPKTCSVCGATDGSALGHTWTDATCTAPKTCSVCGATDGSALGHTWTSATCTTPKTCSVCGATDGSALGHTWIAATCTTPKTCFVCGAIDGEALGHTWIAATCTTPKTCSVCGTIEGTALGHTWIDATCTTPKTCSVCGTIEGTALGHTWIDATCTTPKTCSRCSATEGTALGHDLQDDWETISESTDSEHGVQERYCHRDSCDYFESRDLNIIGNPENNSIQNLTEGANYELNTRLTFSAVGAGMSNTDPINGDVRYVPSAWSIQGTAGSWLDNYSGAFSISKSGTYTLTVTFQKQVYNSGWTSTDIADSKSVTFTVGGVSTDGSDDAVRINPSTGDDTPILPVVIALAAALIAIILVIVYKKKRK